MKKTIILIIGALLIGAGAGYYIKTPTITTQSTETSVTPTTTELVATTNTPHKTDTTVINTPIKTGAFLDLLSPKGGENLCKGDNLNISWRGSKEFDIVDVYLDRGSISNSTTYPLGSFPSSYNDTGVKDGGGSYTWKVGYTKAGIELPPDESYRIILNGCYPNAGNDTGCTMTLNKNPKSFSILDCRG